MEKELPKGWILIQLGDLFLIERGGSPRPIDDYITDAEDGINWIKIGDTKGITKYIFKTKEKIKPEGLYKSRMVYEDDFILSNSMSFGHPFIMKTSGCIHDGWLVIRPNKKIVDLNYLYYMLSSSFVYQQFSSLAKGSTVKNLNIVAVQQVYIYLPPLPEQQHIVAKLETLFGHLDALKTRLDRIPQLLKDFRQKVLTQAVTGKLTEEWREGKELGKWKNEKLEDISERITVGYVGKMIDQYSDSGIPFLRSQNVRAFRFSDINLLYISAEFNEEVKKSKLYPGDVVIVRSGYPGTTCVIPDTLVEANCSDILICTPKKKRLNPHYVSIFMNSDYGKEIVFEGKVGNAQQHFNTKTLKTTIIPLPSLVEQHEIVCRVESLFAKADQIEASYQKIKTKIEQLPQALLAKAFRGELVKQLPTDGDTKELLEEIRKAKAGLEKGGRTKKMKKNDEVRMVAKDGVKYGK